MWTQNYYPISGNLWLSALVASVPVFVLLFMIAVRREAAWKSALAGLAAAVVVAWAAVQFYVLPHAMTAAKAPDPAMISLVSRVLGTLDGALMLVLAYYFGSSTGSDRKTELMAGQK